MKTEERRILVTSDVQIRVGELLELRKCLFCGRTHRQLVLASKTFRDDDTRYFEITNACSPYLFKHYENAISERRLFRIDVGLLDEENPYTTKSRPSGVDYEKHRQMVRAHFDSRAVLKRLGKVSPQ